MSIQGQWRGNVDGDWFGALESSSVVNLSAVLTGAGYVSANPSFLGVDASSGYFEPNIRRRTKKEAYKEREALRLKIESIQQVAEKVVEKAAKPKIEVDTKEIEYYYRPDIADLTKLLMAELRVTVALPDYRRAIEIAIAVRQEEEDLEAILLLM